MSVDYLEFLKNKFIKEFEEAEQEYESLPFKRRLKKITKDKIQKIGQSAPVSTKNHLLDLGYLLRECSIVAQEQREKQEEDAEKRRRGRRILLSSSAFNRINYLCFNLRTWRRLRSIEKELSPGETGSKPDSSTGEQLMVFGPASTFDRSRVHGFDGELKEIEDLLLQQGCDGDLGVKTIGIVGIGGAGKTTLARAAFNSKRVSKLFLFKFWVRFSQQFKPENEDSRRNIVIKILESSANEEMIKLLDISVQEIKNATLKRLLELLYELLSLGNYLIVLDNVWYESDWYSNLGSARRSGNFNYLSDGLPRRTWSGIIVTSRFKDVAKSMVGEQNLHQVKPLDGSHCRSIFLDSINDKKLSKPEIEKFVANNLAKVFPNGTEGRDLITSIMEDVKHNCNGLPLAAKTFAEVIALRIWNSNRENERSDTPPDRVFKLRLDVDDCELSLEDIRNRLNSCKPDGVNSAAYCVERNNIVIEESHYKEAKKLLGTFCFPELFIHSGREDTIDFSREAHQTTPALR